VTRPFFKNLLATIVGLAASLFTISVLEWLNARFYKMPADLSLADHEGMARWIKTLPAAAFVLLIAAYFLGTLIGASIGGLLSASQPARIASIVTGILILFGVLNFMQLPHPTWVVITSTVAYIVAGLLGARFGSLLWARRQILRSKGV
jgi:hypothetical protein